MKKSPFCPEWMDDLIIYQLRIDTFTQEGTFRAAQEHLHELSELGITALWLAPIYEANTDPSQGHVNKRFCNFDVKEPDRLHEKLGNKESFDHFVRKAHQFGIKVILEIIPHGVTFNSSLVSMHPEWFKHGEDGSITGSWGMADFDFSNQDFVKWWICNAVDWVQKYDVDGFRCDLEPDVSGYDVFRRVLEKCRQNGKDILLISELSSTREDTYHLEQAGVGYIHPSQGSGDCLYEKNIVDSIKNGIDFGNNGEEKYYTFCVSNHDAFCYKIRLSPLRLGYDALFPPFIPVFFAGEEFGNSDDSHKAVLFFNPVNREIARNKKNREFIQLFKQFVQIRRNYKHILGFPFDSIKECNMNKVKSNLDLQAYARFTEKELIVVAGNCGRRKAGYQEKCGKWIVEYSEISQNGADPAEIKLPPVNLKDMTIKFGLTTFYTPFEYDRRMSGFAGIKFVDRISVKTIVFCSDGSISIFEDENEIAATSSKTTAQHGIQVTVKIVQNEISVYIGREKLLCCNKVKNSEGAVSFITDNLHAHFRNVRIYEGGNLVFSDHFKGDRKFAEFAIDKNEYGLKTNNIQCTELISNKKIPLRIHNNQIILNSYIKGNDIKLFHLTEIDGKGITIKQR